MTQQYSVFTDIPGSTRATYRPDRIESDRVGLMAARRGRREHTRFQTCLSDSHTISVFVFFTLVSFLQLSSTTQFRGHPYGGAGWLAMHLLYSLNLINVLHCRQPALLPLVVVLFFPIYFSCLFSMPFSFALITRTPFSSFLCFSSSSSCYCHWNAIKLQERDSMALQHGFEQNFSRAEEHCLFQ